MNEVNQIINTTDYSIFRKMHGNRGVEEKRVKSLVDSIKKIGWVCNPIIVNKNMEVVDGQGRLEALKRLGLPVDYIVSENATLEECRTMNGHNASWKIADYIASFAESGNENYKRIMQIMHYYKVPLETALMSRDYVCNGRTYADWKDGKLVFTEEDFVVANRRMNIYVKYYPIFTRFGGQRRTKEKVIFHLISYGEKHPDFDHIKMIEVLENCDPQKVFTQNFERMLESVQDAWNYNRRKNRLYIYEEYRLDKKVS